MPGEITDLQIEFTVAYLAAVEDWHRKRGRSQGETVADGPPRPHHLEMEHRKEEAIQYLSDSVERRDKTLAAIAELNYEGGPLAEPFPGASPEEMQEITSFANENWSYPKPDPRVMPPPYSAGRHLPAGTGTGPQSSVQAGGRPGAPAPPAYSSAPHPPSPSGPGR